jgi:hypothetical protein
MNASPRRGLPSTQGLTPAELNEQYQQRMPASQAETLPPSRTVNGEPSATGFSGYKSLAELRRRNPQVATLGAAILTLLLVVAIISTAMMVQQSQAHAEAAQGRLAAEHRIQVLSKDLAQAKAKWVDSQTELARTKYCSARQAARLNDASAAAKNYQACLTVLEQLAVADPRNTVHRQREMMLVLPQCGDHARAWALATAFLRSKTRDPDLLVDVARTLAQCSAVVGDNVELRDHYRKGALKALSDALALGYKDLVFLESELDLTPLRQLPEFRQKLDSLKPPGGS